MADKNLESITFPELPDKYVVPQVDNTLTVAGRPADAKKTGDELSDLKGALTAFDAFTDLGSTINLIPNRCPLINGTWSQRRLQNDDYIVCVPALIPVKKGDILCMDSAVSGVEYAYGIYVADNTGSSGYTSWMTTKAEERVLNYTGKLIIQFRKVDYAATIAPNEVTCRVSLKVKDTNTELDDIRIDADGVRHESAGDAVRSQINDLSGTISQCCTGRIRTLDDAEYVFAKVTGNGNKKDDENPTRISVIFYISTPCFMKCQCEEGGGAIVSIYEYDGLHHAIDRDSNYVNSFYANGQGTEGVYTYSTAPYTAMIPAGYWLSIGLKKADGSVISDAEKATLLASLNVELIDAIFPDIDAITNVWSTRKNVCAKENYIYKIRTVDPYPIDVSDANRGRVIFPINKASKYVIINTDYEFGVGAFGTIANACQQSSGTGVGARGYTSYQPAKTFASGTINKCFLCVSFKKPDNSVITAEQFESFYNSLYVLIVEAEEADQNNEKELYIGEFVQKAVSASGHVNSVRRISMKDLVAFPFGFSHKIKVHINNGYAFAIRTGETATDIYNNMYWYYDGDEITIPKTHNYYRIIIANKEWGVSDSDTVPIYPNENIGLRVTYEEAVSSVNDRNAEASKTLSASRLNTSTPRSIFTFPTIAHGSDVHGDYTRAKNLIDYCKNNGIDIACFTGDIVAYDPSHGLGWFAELVNNAKTNIAVCTGNHDVYNDSYDDDDIYEFMFADIATKIGNTTGKTWYCKDIANQSLRVISLNLYQYGGTNRRYSHFTDDQITFFINALSSTPSNYGVIVLAHDPQMGLSNAKDSNYPTFFQDVRLYDSPHTAVNGFPIFDIIDAFISKTTLSRTYTQTGSPSSITVSADFTSLNTGVEFIAHLTGHFHQDTVCFVPNTTNRQLMLNVTCTNSLYGGSAYPYLADLSDLARNKQDASQDSFNVYTIDRANKKVKITRIGMNKTFNMTDRDYMEIPYAVVT